jgi:hypothetical protein
VTGLAYGIATAFMYFAVLCNVHKQQGNYVFVVLYEVPCGYVGDKSGD